jgi:hypothetical protein
LYPVQLLAPIILILGPSFDRVSIEQRKVFVRFEKINMNINDLSAESAFDVVCDIPW